MALKDLIKQQAGQPIINPQNYQQFGGQFQIAPQGNIMPTSTNPALNPAWKPLGAGSVQNQTLASPTPQVNQGGFNLTPTPEQNQTALGYDPTKMINQAMLQGGKDPFQLDQQSPDTLQQILDAVNQRFTSLQQGQNQYLQAFQQARGEAGIPSLEQKIQDINSQIAQRNLAYQTTANQIEDQSIPMGNIVGQQASLQRQQQAELTNLTAQQQNAVQQYGLAQNQQTAQMGAATQGLNLQTPQALVGLAQQYFGVPQAAAQVGLTQAQAQQAQAQAGFYQNIYGGLTGQAQGQAQGGLPQFLQGAATTDINGQQYIVEGRVPALGGMGLDAAKSYAGKLGVPILTDTQASSITALDTTQNNLADLQSKIGGLLGSGLAGTLQGKTLNQVEQLLGVGKGPALTQINSFRESAIKQIQGLASGQSGLRLNQAEIDSAIKNLPTTQDNIETANAKMQQLAVFFANQRAAIYALGGLKSSAAAMGGSVGWGTFNQGIK